MSINNFPDSNFYSYIFKNLNLKLIENLLTKY